MTDEEWEKQRNRAIAAAFETGRPVFADSEGEMRFADGTQEPLPAAGEPRAVEHVSMRSRIKRWLRGGR